MKFIVSSKFESGIYHTPFLYEDPDYTFDELAY